MKRRGFLQLIGAGIAAPLMPSASFGAAPQHLGAAIAHARARVSISAWGLSQSLGVTMAQADGLMAEMVQRGAIAQIQGGGGRWALSRVYTTPLPAHIQRPEAPSGKDGQTHTAQTTEPNDSDPLLAHLHQMCRANGHIVTRRGAV